MAQNKDIINLVKLGFTENDALVYLALTELKTSTANPIINQSGLHRSLVYTALEHLVAKKLVSEFENNGKKNFTVVSPEILVEEFSEKKKIAELTVKNIKEKLSSDTQEVTIHRGNEEYLSVLITLIKQMPKNSTKYIMGTGGESFMKETMQPIWKKYHDAVKASGISIKMIGYENQKKFFEEEANKEGMYHIKYLSADSENPAGIHIYPEAEVVLNIIYSDKNQPVTVIKIKDKKMVAGYLNLFKSLWTKAV